MLAVLLLQIILFIFALVALDGGRILAYYVAAIVTLDCAFVILSRMRLNPVMLKIIFLILSGVFLVWLFF